MDSANALRARLQRLEGMGLAERMDANRWELLPGMATTLDAMGQREDALETVHRALKAERREGVVDERLTSPVIGRIAGKGLIDELNDRGYLVVDGIDGRAHYLKLPAGTDLADLPIHGILEARPPGQERPVDGRIVSVARDGLYKTAEHVAQLKQAKVRDPQFTVDGHVRRLEALRRAGIVERIADGVWSVPPDLLQKARTHDAQKDAGLAIQLRSDLPINQQVRAIGATWLDRQLVDGRSALGGQGFGAQVHDALTDRIDFLAEQGLIRRRGQLIISARDLLLTLCSRELAEAGKALQERSGQTFRPVRTGEQVSGVYRKSIQLVSGRFAVLDDGSSFSLVPWRPVIDQRLGTKLSAVIRGDQATWRLGRGISV